MRNKEWEIIRACSTRQTSRDPRLTDIQGMNTLACITIFSETHSAAWLTLAALATFGAEGLFGPVGGILGDRLDRKRLMVVCELIGAVCFFIGALLLLPERTEETHGQAMATGGKGAVDVGGG